MIETHPVNKPVTALALLALLGGAVYIQNAIPNGKTALYLIGAAMGVALYHAAFGFTSGWRDLVNRGDGRSMRAQLFTFGLAAILFMPVLVNGEFLGHGIIPAAAPVGVAMLLGAFMFGFGMQLGGGCASGTLYTVGGGSGRMMITLVFFIIGSLVGSAHLPWWFSTPRFKTIVLQDQIGLWPALLLTLSLLGLLAIMTIFLEHKIHKSSQPAVIADNQSRHSLLRTLLRGRWPLLWGAIGLALGNFAVLAVSGHAWSISFGYALWGAKLAALFGLDVSHSEFWTWGYPSRALKGSLFAEDTSAMNFGILVGAALAAGLAGRFGKFVKLPWQSVLAAIIGGLLMGYGARLASGCNIGALFSGIASGSLHGWAWLVAGFIGSYLGIKARPYFKL